MRIPCGKEQKTKLLLPTQKTTIVVTGKSTGSEEMRDHHLQDFVGACGAHVWAGVRVMLLRIILCCVQ